MSEETEHSLKDLAEPVNVYINNPIAKKFVDVLKNTFVTPNQVTYLSVVVGFASGYSFSQGTWIASAIGGLLLELTLVLDCVDGQLARAKKWRVTGGDSSMALPVTLPTWQWFLGL